MRKFLMAVVPTAAIAAALLALAPMASETTAGAATGSAKVVGYTLLDRNNDHLCELATVDWATGVVTDLPSPASETSCAGDLAVTPSGTVIGLDLAGYMPGATGLSAPAIVSYATDGTPTRVPIGFAGAYVIDPNYVDIFSSIAVDTDGTVYVLFSTVPGNVVTCAPLTLGSVDGAAAESPALDDGTGNIPCLFTANPSTGVLTLVGSSRITSGVAQVLAIGSDGMRTNANPTFFDASLDTVGPTSATPFYWSTVNKATGEVTLSAIPVDGSSSMPFAFDALRSGTTVFTFTAKDGDANPWTATVDPSTGIVTPIARMNVAFGGIQVFLSLAVTTVADEIVVPKITG